MMFARFGFEKDSRERNQLPQDICGHNFCFRFGVPCVSVAGSDKGNCGKDLSCRAEPDGESNIEYGLDCDFGLCGFLHVQAGEAW